RGLRRDALRQPQPDAGQRHQVLRPRRPQARRRTRGRHRGPRRSAVVAAHGRRGRVGSSRVGVHVAANGPGPGCGAGSARSSLDGVSSRRGFRPPYGAPPRRRAARGATARGSTRPPGLLWV
ncbi:MAG: Phosphoglucosamine mutase, partial [uncultured Actinomycetospora sp.]